MIVACVCASHHYVKRKIRTRGTTNQNVIANEAGNTDSQQPQPATFSYNRLSEDCNIDTTTTDSTSESLPSSNKPPANASNNVVMETPAT